MFQESIACTGQSVETSATHKQLINTLLKISREEWRGHENFSNIAILLHSHEEFRRSSREFYKQVKVLDARKLKSPAGYSLAQLKRQFQEWQVFIFINL